MTIIKAGAALRAASRGGEIRCPDEVEVDLSWPPELNDAMALTIAC